MKYKSGSAFRRALEDRLREQAVGSGLPLERLRKLVAFDRFLGRLLMSNPNGWMLKGGFALQLRFGKRSRTTKDLDLLQRGTGAVSWQLLRQAAAVDLEDWFEFEVGRPRPERTEDQLGGLRFPVRSLLDGRTFEDFHLDVGSGDPVLEQPEILATPALLGFAGIEPVAFPTYPLTQQIAEKLHAYTRSFDGSQSSRVRDFVDILLIASLANLDGKTLGKAIQRTFDVRATHSIPQELPQPPSEWSTSFRRSATELGLDMRRLAEAADAVRAFLDPVLAGTPVARWNPLNWQWEK